MVFKSSSIDLKKDSIPKLFFYYFIPALCTMLCLSTYSTIDGIFVGKKIGENGLAAIGICWAIFPAFIAFELLFAFGGAALVSYFLGKDQAHRARLVFSSVFYCVAVMSLVFLGIGVIFTHEILDILIAGKPLSQEIRALAQEYLFIIFLGTPFFLLHPLSDIFVINDKRPILGTIAMLIGALSNIALNYFFLFVLDMGIDGSALATLCAHAITFFILFLHFLRRRGKLYFIPRFSFAAVISSAKTGLPESVSELSASIVMLLFNATLLSVVGDKGVQIYSIVMYCGIVFFTILLSVSQALQPIASFNYGAGNFARLRQILLFSLLMVVGIGVALYALFYAFDRHLVELFLRDKDSTLLSESIEAMSVYYIGYVILGVNIVCAVFLQSVQRTKSSFIITMCHAILFLAILLPLMGEKWGAMGAWSSYPLAQACALIVTIAVMIYEARYGIFSGKIAAGKEVWRKAKHGKAVESDTRK